VSRRPVVAHVLNTIGLGGVPEAAWQLIRRLPPDRFDQRVYVLRRKQDDAAARGERQARFDDLGIPVSFPDNADDRRIGLIADLCRWLDEGGVDLLHTHSYKPNLTGRLAGVPLRAAGLRIVAHYHNQYDDKYDTEGTLSLDRHLSASTDRIVAVSASVGDHVAERLGVPAERIAVVPNGVDCDRFTNGDRAGARERLDLPPDRPIVALVGRLSEQKGQDDFVRAVADVRPAHPDALFLLVGSADHEETPDRLRDLARSCGVDDAVRLTGHVGDMPSLYAAIDVLAAPSRWEGFGLMLVEAMAAGVPIVASTAGAIPEVVGDGPALLVAPGDPPALAAALTRVLADDDAARAMAAAGRDRARAFSWERSAERLAEVYAEALA
jgi:glycosyltransferase involved in cell wall biosynthesis